MSVSCVLWITVLIPRCNGNGVPCLGFCSTVGEWGGVGCGKGLFMAGWLLGGC
jgi:hypothetical protein